jgi:hypothetical protein
MQVYKFQKHTSLSYKKNNVVRLRHCICSCNYDKRYIQLLKDIRLIINNTNIERACNCRLCKNVCMKSWDELDEIVQKHETMLRQYIVATTTQKETNAWDVIQ